MDSTVFFRPITQYENLGDLVINQELLKVIPIDSNIVIEAKGIPNWFIDALVKDIKIEAIFTDKKSFYKRVICSLFSKGRTYFLDVPGHVFYEQADRSGWSKYLKMRIFGQIGIRYIRLGVSLGPYGESALALEVKKSKAYFFSGVREQYTRQYLKSVGIHKFEYFPDFGFCLDYKQKSEVKPNVVGYSFRAGIISSNAKGAKNTEAICHSLMVLAQDYELQPIVQVNLDNEYMSVLSKRLGVGNDAITFFDHDDEVIFKAYENVKFVISNRLHVLIFALSRGAMAVPYIDRVKHTKITGVFEDIGLSDVIFDIASSGNINEHIEKVSKIYSTFDVGSEFDTKKELIKKIISESVFN